MSKTTVKSVTAADLRAYFRADAKRMDALSPEAQASVREGATGRIHREAIALHNKRRKAQYVPGNTTKVAQQARAEAAALREQAREAGFKVGKRGRLSKEVMEALKG